MSGQFNRCVVLIALIATLFGFGNLVLTPSYPALAEAFHIAPDTVSLVVSVYTLPGIFVSPLYGVFSDRLGRRTLLLPMIMIFGIAGVTAGFTSDFAVLLVARFVQGISGAAFFPLTFIILGDLYEGQQRNIAISNTMLVVMGAGILHPLIGGILTLFSWRFVFYSFIIAIPIFLIALKILPETCPLIAQRQQSTRGTANTPNSDSLEKAPPHLEKSGIPRPDHHSSKLKVAILAVIFIGSMYFFITFGTFMFFTAYYVEQGLGGTPFETGLVQSLQSVVSVLVLTKLAFIMERVSKPILILGSYLALVVGCLTFALPPSLVWVWVASVSLGLSRGVAFTALSAYILDLSSAATRGRNTAVYEATIKIGQTLGPYMFGVAYLEAGSILATPFLLGTVLSSLVCGVCLPMIYFNPQVDLKVS